MNVVLVSGDSNLYNLCAEILAERSNQVSRLSIASLANCPSDADLYIWDTGDPIPLEGLDQCSSRHLFLIERKDIADLRDTPNDVRTNILLKPVTRASLSVFLGLAVSAYEERVLAASLGRTDRDENLQCLILANLRLQEYDHDRTNFLARAVHDLRAPLTAVTGYCELLLNEALGPINEHQRQVLQRMGHSTKRLSQMASAMFELSIGRYVKRRLDLSSGDIRACVEQARHEMLPIAEEKRISIYINLQPERHSLHFERGQIEQLFINILDNACKFTPRGGEVSIEGYPFFWDRPTLQDGNASQSARLDDTPGDPNSYRIDIRDSGSPIPEQYLDTIFEEYTSYAGAQDRSGGGLGLAICRMIATAHDGCIWVENTPEGPMFSLVLPDPSHRSRRFDENSIESHDYTSA
jgi:signal transduction histidine kinase